ncbi:uncharacterized protein LOC105230984 isoform X2 [Bactrocera dorsalis]|uniref:Uncharacterized protein LOC105230984 isoform X2 n=1 Tax=Bactrocera dorsalis TaxID=27457 RepID=A0ABM3J951_BACDO|nr:uncharacterized protein LOC105230984 isoform X2 [Bactrocera dorsalis]
MATNEKNSEAHLTSPDWLNVAFFENILKQVEAESAKVTNLELKPGTLQNDNYSTVMYRTKVNYRLQSQPKQEKTSSFILKVKPFVEGVKKEMLGDLHLFQTEILMYTKMLPKIEKVLRQYGDQTVLAPKLIASSTSPTQTYVMFNDLTVQGYTTIGSRYIHLDEGKIAMLKLAKLHAISYKLNKEREEAASTSLDKGLINSIDPEKFPFIKHGIRLLKEVLSEHVDLKQFVPHIESVEHLLLPKTLELFKAHSSGKRDGLLVLNHGDFHLKNMMIQAVDGKLTDLMLFDYQISIFGSPAIDLHYAFTMMFSPEMRRDHYDVLLNFYISNFQQTLRKMEFKGHIPTDIEIRQELKKHKYWRKLHA